MNQSEKKYEALPHFALMNRVHLRVLRAVEFHREFWQVRKWSYHSVSRRTVRILLDLESHCFGRYSGAPNLRTFLTLINATCGIIIVQFAFFYKSKHSSVNVYIYIFNTTCDNSVRQPVQNSGRTVDDASD